LLFRTMVSISEHIAHCPEKLAYVFDRFLNDKIQEDGGILYVIDIDVLQEGIEGLIKGDFNFDDINESAILNESKTRKIYKEPQGPMVMFDYLRDYHDVGFLKMWIFFFTFVLSRSLAPNFYQMFKEMCLYESLANMLIQVILFFYYFYQQQKFPTENIPGIVYAIVSVCISMFVINKLNDDQLIPVIVIAYFFIFRFVYIVIPTGYYRTCFKKDTYATQMSGIVKPKDNTKTFLEDRLDLDTKIKPTAEAPKAHEFTQKWQTWLFWFLILVCTFLFEFFFANIIGQMTYSYLCYWPQRCEKENLFISAYESNLCFSCVMTIVVAWTLMIISILIDTPIFFTVFVSFIGYYKGQLRKLQNVNASYMVDLRRERTHRKDLELMFGNWEDQAWPIWKTVIDELYTRDLISKYDKEILRGTGKMYDFSHINPEARERLSFFLKTINRLHRHEKRIQEKNKKIEKQKVMKEQEKETKKEEEKKKRMFLTSMRMK